MLRFRRDCGEARIPTGYISRCIGTACLFLLYARLIRSPDGPWATYFLVAGALAAIGHMSVIVPWRRPAGERASRFRGGIAAVAADLAALLALQQGFIQAKVEWGRGNALGMFTCLVLVTPILILATRACVLMAGSRKWYPIC